MLLTVRDRGSRDESALSIIKRPQPEIRRFDCLTTGYNIDDPLTFTWELANADGCHVFLDGNRIFSGTSATSTAADRDYRLQVEDPLTGFLAVKTFTPQFTFLKSFAFAPGGSCQRVNLSWEATPSVESCTIEGVGGVPNVGSRQVDVDHDQVFRLEGTVKHTTRTVSMEISLTVPVIDSFQAHVVKSAPPTGDGEFLTVEEAFYPASAPIMCPPYEDPPGPDPPPVYKRVRAVWKAHGGDSYSIEGSSCPASGEQEISVVDYQSTVTLHARLSHGYEVRRSVSI